MIFILGEYSFAKVTNIDVRLKLMILLINVATNVYTYLQRL